MYRYKKKKGKKKERSTKTSLNSLARNARTFRKLSLSVRRICRAFCLVMVTMMRVIVFYVTAFVMTVFANTFKF